MQSIQRKVLLNPGPATTTDTVKMAQVVPDICPREKEFAGKMKSLREDLLKVAHADPARYTAVLFCGSGTINIDICVNSLLPEGKKILVVDNGAYNSRAVEVCQYYGLPHIDLKSSVFALNSYIPLAMFVLIFLFLFKYDYEEKLPAIIKDNERIEAEMLAKGE